MPDPSTPPQCVAQGPAGSEVRARLSWLRLSPAREAEIVDELSQHLDDRYRELVAGGASPEEATQVALGAQFGDVRKMFLRQRLSLTATGIALGIGLAIVLTRVMSAFLYGVGPLDPMTRSRVRRALGRRPAGDIPSRPPCLARGSHHGLEGGRLARRSSGGASPFSAWQRDQNLTPAVMPKVRGRPLSPRNPDCASGKAKATGT